MSLLLLKDNIGSKKSENTQQENLVSLKLELKAADTELQVVYGEVYSPYKIDTQKDFAPKSVIRQLAWDFLSSGKVNNIDVMHDFKSSGAKVVESFIAREGDPVFDEGAWVLVTQLPDHLWQEVKSGNLNGYSLAGFLTKYPVTVDANMESKIEGVTDTVKTDAIVEHSHQYIIFLTDEGSIVYGKAFKGDNDHEHNITRATATDPSCNHSHRFCI